MKIVFAGTPDFAATALQTLQRNGHDVALVLTQPDGGTKPAAAEPQRRCSDAGASRFESNGRQRSPWSDGAKRKRRDSAECAALGNESAGIQRRWTQWRRQLEWIVWRRSKQYGVSVVGNIDFFWKQCTKFKQRRRRAAALITGSTKYSEQKAPRWGLLHFYEEICGHCRPSSIGGGMMREQRHGDKAVCATQRFLMLLLNA